MTVTSYIEVLNSTEEEDKINECCLFIAKNIEEALKKPTLFDLPFEIIAKITEKIDINQIINPYDVIKSILERTNEKYPSKTILLLSSFSTIEPSTLTFNQILEILLKSSSNQFFKQLSQLYEEENHQPEFDYNYEIAQLKEQIHSFARRQYPAIIDKPDDYEPSIFNAIVMGKLSSVQYYTQHSKLNVNKNIQCYYNIDSDCVFISPRQVDDSWKPVQLNMLHLACFYGHLDIVEYLLEGQYAYKEAKASNGATPLLFACQSGYINIIKYLCEKQHVNIDVKENWCGSAPIHFACERGDLDVVKYLCEKQHVNIDVKENSAGFAPIHFACLNGHLDVVKYLCEKQHVNIDVKENLDGYAPIHIACLNGHLDVIKYLCEKQHVNIDVKENLDGFAPIHFACKRGHLDVIKYLCEKQHVNIDVKDNLGRNPLEMAHSYNHFDVENYLLEKITKNQ